MRSGAVFIILHDHTLSDARQFKQPLYKKMLIEIIRTLPIRESLR